MRSTLGVLLLVACVFESGCGGRAREEATFAGPPHDGMGLYDL